MCKTKQIEEKGQIVGANARGSYYLYYLLRFFTNFFSFDTFCILVFLYVFVKALPNTVTSLTNSCLAVSLPDNICISDAQYYELNARRNLWCEILEFLSVWGYIANTQPVMRFVGKIRKQAGCQSGTFRVS